MTGPVCRFARGLLLFVAVVILADLRSTGAELVDVLIDGIPHVRQKPDFCGEACADMYLRKLGVAIDQDGVFDRSGLNPALGRGCYTVDLLTALKRIGFKVGPVWSTVLVSDAAQRLKQEFAALHADLLAGVPSIVCTRYDDRPQTTEHFRLVVGYEVAADVVIYHDPALADGAYRRMPRAQFLRLWPLKYETEKWTVVRLRLEPTAIVNPSPKRSRFTNADYAQHILRLRSKTIRSGDEFSIVIEKPFVVIGDEPLDKVKEHSRDTVKWTVARLKKDYFEKDPSEILDIWLFQDSVSYEHRVERLFGEKPTTPYGFFSPRHKALIMNIATGGGTLVHEIVHPFMAANFPDCPSWFNEGLASLYQQASERNGHMIGLTNWRLHGLQQAIRKETVPSFETLCGKTTEEFYEHDRGTNYAQARYLCYYLQEHGLLVKYYQAFRMNVTRDPTGYDTLKTVLRTNDMTDFQKQWQAYVLELTFEG